MREFTGNRKSRIAEKAINTGARNTTKSSKTVEKGIAVDATR